VTAVAAVDLPDGVNYDPTTISGQQIRSATEYGGVRVHLLGFLGTARERIRIDVGFGDALPAGPVTIDFPTLLSDETPSLLAYSFQTVIAEKLQAATILFDVNSRYKDFYDIHALATREEFDATTLHCALEATFQQRGMRVVDIGRLFSTAFTDDSKRQSQWSAFRRRVDQRAPERFSSLMNDLRRFLEPILFEPSVRRWRPAAWSWEGEA